MRALGPSTGCSTACALAGRRCSLCGWRKGVPGVVPSTIVRNVWCQALSLPRPPVHWSGWPGFRDPCVPGAVSAGAGTQHQPNSVLTCGPALLAVGRAEGRPRGGCLPPLCEGCLRAGAVPPLTARPLGGLLGSATHVLWARVCGCGVPTLSPLAACPLGAACRGGGGGPSPGGLACHRCEGRLVSGAVSPPAACPLEQAAMVPRPVCPDAVGAGVGTPHRPHSVRPCGLALLPVGVVEGRPRGGCLPPL